MPAPKQVPPSTGRGSLIDSPLTGLVARRRSREARLERGVLGGFALLALTVSGFAGYAITHGSRPYAVQAVLPAAITSFAWNRPAPERAAPPVIDLDPTTTGALPERRPAMPALPEAPEAVGTYTLRRVSGGTAIVTGAGGTEREISAGSDLPGAGRVSGTMLLKTLDFSGTNEARFTLTTQLGAGKVSSATIVLNKDTLASIAHDLTAVKATEIYSAIQGQIEDSGEAGIAGKVKSGLDVFDSLVFTTSDYTDLGADGQPGGVGDNADTDYAGTGASRTVTLRVAPPASGKTAVDIGFGTDVAPDLAAQTVTDAYLRQSIENDAGDEDTGVRLALYFARKAPDIKSAYDILGDTALTQVANTLLGLPTASSSTSSDALAQRAKKIAEKIDIASLKDPAAVEKLAKRFAAIWDAQNNTASAPILALFASDDGSADTLLSLAASWAGA